MNPFGFTRSVIKRNHALVTPESHVAAALPGWQKAQGIIVISPRLGADFSQYFVRMEAGASSGAPLPGVEQLCFCGGRRKAGFTFRVATDAALDVGGYAYLLRTHHTCSNRSSPHA
ncbi:MAG: hypothetical protein R2856_29370 [Caldilineaceae bacterium]